MNFKRNYNNFYFSKGPVKDTSDRGLPAIRKTISLYNESIKSFEERHDTFNLGVVNRQK